MAKTCMIEKEGKRKRLPKQYGKRRASAERDHHG